MGYHYDPIDYITQMLGVTNATVTVTNGSAIACYNTNGILLRDGSAIVSMGTPLSPNRFARYSSVQEQSVSPVGNPPSAGRNVTAWPSGSVGPNGTFRFTQFSCPADGSYNIYDSADTTYNTLVVQDCELWNGEWDFSGPGSGSATAIVKNNLFYRSSGNAKVNSSQAFLSFSNNLFWGGSVSLTAFSSNSWQAHDNAFDSCSITCRGSITNSYNAYLNCSGRLNPTNVFDIITNNTLAYQPGPLGYFYQPTNSLLIHAGDVMAGQVGLYHYTVTTNQVVEGTNTVSIGYHYVTVTNGVPIDTDGDGIPDYIEDANGNGLADSGETSWLDTDTDYDGCSDYEELLEGTGPLDAGSFTPLQLGYFRFNDTNWLGTRGQSPLVTSNLHLVDGWITKALEVNTNGAILKYRDVESGGAANINLRSGTVRFWFKPEWTSGAGGPGTAAKLIEVGSQGASVTNGWWALYFNAQGTSLIFVSQTNNMNATTNLTATVSLVSNQWCQVVLTFTTNGFALYTNGVLAATNTGTLQWPGLAQRQTGFTVGSGTDGSNQAKGVFEDLETFNYPLNANDILNNFQLTQPPNLIPNLFLWLKADVIGKSVTNKVSEWDDQSGNGNNAIQGSDSSRPLYVTNGISGKPAVYFPSTNSTWLGLPYGMFSNAVQVEGFVALNVDSNTPPTPRGLWRIGGTSSLYPNTDGSISDSFGASGLIGSGPASQSLEQPHIYNVYSKTNDWGASINGIPYAAANNNSVQFTPAVRLGDGNNYYFAGHIGEVLIYTRVLTINERMAVGAYLSQRYNIATNAPATPKGMTALAVSTNQISVTWTAELTNAGVNYTLQRRTAGGSYGTVTVLQNATSYLDSDLAAGTQVPLPG